MKKILIFLVFITVGCSSQKKEPEAELIHAPLINNPWKLISPKTREDCSLALSFSDKNKMEMNYRGTSYEGFYEIDTTLTNYITINIFNKLGWDEPCEVNPEYLSLYEEDTQFSYEIVYDYLYFRKNEKVIIFEKASATDTTKKLTSATREQQ